MPLLIVCIYFYHYVNLPQIVYLAELLFLIQTIYSGGSCVMLNFLLFIILFITLMVCWPNLSPNC